MTGGKKPATNWRTRHIDEPLGERVAQLRGESGFSRSDLARALRVSAGSLQHLEEGRNRFSAAQLWQICGILGIGIAEVYAGLTRQVWASRAEYETVSGSTGAREMAEEAAPFVPAPTARPQIRALAKASRSLTTAQIDLLVAAAKGMQRSPDR